MVAQANMMELHTRVDSIYERHGDAFKILEDIFLEEHSIPCSITRDAVKQRILGGLENQLPNQWLHSPNGIIRSLMRYAVVMSYLLWCALFGGRRRRVDVDVLFEYFSPDCGDFYDEIIKGLGSVNFAGLGHLLYEEHKWSCIPQAKRFVRKNRPYSRKSAQTVLWVHCLRFGIYWSLTKQTHIDFVDIALRLSLEVAGHLTWTEGISAKVLVSANDNGYSPYRYYLYRSSGIDAIFLIQNGGRVGLTEFFNSYIYSDFYIGWSQQRLDDFIEMRCKNKIALGSVKLNKFLRGRTGKESIVQYDIIFAEQNYFLDHPQYPLYSKLLQNLARYSLEHPEIATAYCRRPGMHAHPELCEQINAVLHNSAVTILDSIGGFSSYEQVLMSSVLVSLDSSLRCEAVMLGKPVISCTNRIDDFVVKYSAPCFVMPSDGYDVFASKLDFLLSNLEAPSVVESFKRLREAMDNSMEGNVSMAVANLIKEELHCG